MYTLKSFLFPLPSVLRHLTYIKQPNKAVSDNVTTFHEKKIPALSHSILCYIFTTPFSRILLEETYSFHILDLPHMPPFYLTRLVVQNTPFHIFDHYSIHPPVTLIYPVVPFFLLSIKFFNALSSLPSFSVFIPFPCLHVAFSYNLPSLLFSLSAGTLSNHILFLFQSIHHSVTSFYNFLPSACYTLCQESEIHKS